MTVGPGRPEHPRPLAAAAVVSAEPDQTVALVYVDQTTAIGKDAPPPANSSVRVSMERADERWLISGFEALPDSPSR